MTEPEAAVGNCEHHYETRLLGGHPITVRACVLCRKPDWADLAEQAATLYQWGREEALAGKPAREHLSAYDMPQPLDDKRRPAHIARLDDWPSVREAAANDRRWPLEKAGE
jgi:hypothetical protein